MEKLTITADQICVGDIIGGYEVLDFDIVGEMVSVTVGKSFDDEQVWEFVQDATLEIETDYVSRDSDSGDSEDWEDALDQTYFDIDNRGADNIVESVGDLLDY